MTLGGVLGSPTTAQPCTYKTVCVNRKRMHTVASSADLDADPASAHAVWVKFCYAALDDGEDTALNVRALALLLPLAPVLNDDCLLKMLGALGWDYEPEDHLHDETCMLHKAKYR